MYTINLAFPFFAAFAVLMLAGTIPFTPAAVVALVVLSTINLAVKW